jgi:hypothetical protein
MAADARDIEVVVAQRNGGVGAADPVARIGTEDVVTRDEWRVGAAVGVVADVDGGVEGVAAGSARRRHSVGARSFGDAAAPGGAPAAGPPPPTPPKAEASAPSPEAIAKSPVPDVAVAVPSWSSEYPSTEMAKFRSDVEKIGTAEAPNRSDNQSVDESAEAIHGKEATAAPIPKPTASTPSLAIPRASFMSVPFSTATSTGCRFGGSAYRCDFTMRLGWHQEHPSRRVDPHAKGRRFSPVSRPSSLPGAFLVADSLCCSPGEGGPPQLKQIRQTGFNFQS